MIITYNGHSAVGKMAAVVGGIGLLPKHLVTATTWKLRRRRRRREDEAKEEVEEKRAQAVSLKEARFSC